MGERLDVRCEIDDGIERDHFDEFDDAIRKVLEIEKPEDRYDSDDLASVLRMRVDTIFALYNWERRER